MNCSNLEGLLQSSPGNRWIQVDFPGEVCHILAHHFSATIYNIAKSIKEQEGLSEIDDELNVGPNFSSIDVHSSSLVVNISDGIILPNSIAPIVEAMVFYANTFNPGIIKNINGTLESMELRRDMDISEILRTLVDNEYTAIADEGYVAIKSIDNFIYLLMPELKEDLSVKNGFHRLSWVFLRNIGDDDKNDLLGKIDFFLGEGISGLLGIIEELKKISGYLPCNLRREIESLQSSNNKEVDIMAIFRVFVSIYVDGITKEKGGLYTILGNLLSGLLLLIGYLSTRSLDTKIEEYNNRNISDDAFINDMEKYIMLIIYITRNVSLYPDDIKEVPQMYLGRWYSSCLGFDVSIDEIQKYERSHVKRVIDILKAKSKKIILKIVFSKPKLFVADDCIQKERLFDYLCTVGDDVRLEEIYEYFNSDKYKKTLKEDEVIAILQNGIDQSEYICDSLLVTCAIGYINMGVDAHKIRKASVQVLQSLKMMRLMSVAEIEHFLDITSGKPDKVSDIARGKGIIEQIESDLLYLHRSNTGVGELYALVDKGYVSTDSTEIQKQKESIYQQYNIPEKIKKNKRILSSKDPRIFMPVLGHIFDIVGKHFSGGSGKTHREGIITYIFRQDEVAILFLSDVLERLHFVKGDTLTTVVECLNLCVRKRLFISEIIRGRDTYTLSELKEQLSEEEIYYNRRVGEVFGDDYDIGTDKQRISLILKIGELLDDSDREDFILYVTPDTSLQFLINIYRVIVILKRFNAAYGVISELLTMNLDEGSISTLYKRLKGRNANNVNGTDMRRMILGYLDNGDVGNFASLDTIIMVKPDFQIREDIMLAEGIERNDVEELNTIADGIDSMIGEILELFHPSRVSSTRNNDFGKGSGSFTKRVNRYVFSVLLRKTDEGAIEYLHRIKQVNWSELLEIDLSDIHDSSFSLIKIIFLKHKNTYGLFYSLTHFGQIIESFAASSGNGSRSQSVNLRGLSGYYDNVLEGAMKKVSLFKDNH